MVRLTKVRAAVFCMVWSLAGAGTASAGAGSDTITDDEIKDRIIEESLTLYNGSWPCPYNIHTSGARCGARSAFSRTDTETSLGTPLCYRVQVSNEMIERYRRGNPDIAN